MNEDKLKYALAGYPLRDELGRKVTDFRKDSFTNKGYVYTVDYGQYRYVGDAINEIKLQLDHEEAKRIEWKAPEGFHDKVKQSPLTKQVGGKHYKDMAIQPVEYCQKNKLGCLESFVIKYVSRHNSKNGKQDLEKAKHCIEMLIELEYTENK